MNNPFLKNNSVISSRFVSDPEVQTKDNLEAVNLSLFGNMLRLKQEEILKKNINLLEGGFALKDQYFKKFYYLEISFNNTWNFSYKSIDTNYSDKFYIAIDGGMSYTAIYIKTQEGLSSGLSKLVPVITDGNTQLREGWNECEIDYRQYKHLLQIYWYVLYSKFNINICAPPPLYWRKNDQRFKKGGEFFEINLVSTEVTLFINLLNIFPFEVTKILYQIFRNMELNLFEDFSKQIFALSLDKQYLQRTKALAIESLQKKRRFFTFDKMQFETKEYQFPEEDNLYTFDWTATGFVEYCEFRDFLINGPFDYQESDVLDGLHTALFGKGQEVVLTPTADWVKFNEEFLIIKGFTSEY